MTINSPIRVHPRNPRSICQSWRWLLLAVILAGSAAQAADEDDDAPPQQPGQPVFILTPETFDQWVFSSVPNSTQALREIDSQAKLQIEAIDRVCSLSKGQELKLELAADRDIKKFRDQYEALKSKFQNTKQNPNNLTSVYTAIAPLQQQWNAGILGESSMLNKVIESTLTGEQWTAYQNELSQRKNYRYRAKIKLALAALESTIPLSDEQREQFEKLLVAETKPPKKFSQYDVQVVFLQAASLPDAKLKNIFDDGQVKSLKQVFQQVKGMERLLREQDVLPD
jgi:hypothetical protein